MKNTTAFILVCALMVMMFCCFGCGGGEKSVENVETKEESVQAEAEKEALQPESFDIKLPLSEDTQTVQAQIPSTWIRNPQFGSVVFQPQDYENYFYPPMIQYEISCAGSCDPDAIPGNIEKQIKSIKDTLIRPNINTGDPELDAIRANVEILAEERISDDGWIIACQVIYPEHLSSALYVPKVVIHTYRYHPGDRFFVHTSAHIDLKQKDELLSVLMEACKKTDY